MSILRHWQHNFARSDKEYLTAQPVHNFGVMRETVQTPSADRREAAHYVHDNALSTQYLEDWL